AEDLHGAARAAIAATVALAGADRARCLFHDEDGGQVWAEGEGDEAGDGPEREASAGLVGFAIRTAAAVSVPRAGDDALYLRDLDDPAGGGRERLLVQPVTGLDGHVHAVLVAVREERAPPFGEAELDALAGLASAWAPYLQQLEMRVEADNILGDRLDRGPSDLFRQEAIMSLVRRGARGDVVRVHPGWVRAAYWLVLLSLAGAVSFAAFARVHQYAEGPAIVRFTGRSDVVALEGGTITALDVVRGQAVAEGEVLARLYDAEQLTRLRGLDTEFERKLVTYLQTPADPVTRRDLAAIVSQRETARASLASRVIRAPRAGTVKEVYVANGKVVQPGKVVLSLVEAGAAEGLSVVAFLPGSERPRLRPRQRLLLALPGYRGVRIPAEVRGVSSEVLGAAEARTRYLGERVGESFPVEGNVVVIDAVLASEQFESDGQVFSLHDGMVGLVEVQLASKSVLETVIPGFK
ncbi:MAG: HlyD family efflux transporter periplasmic adaptor subunit, partial [Deltaproteobacteria bacterium]|nr:HlyD family efflux transporter periplasmic adaptor subunit [Deltaproteobacteria bacterium]